MSATKKKIKSKKKTTGATPATQNNPFQLAIADLMMAISSSETDDKIALINQIVANIQAKPTGRKRVIGEDVAKKTFTEILESLRSPDVPALWALECTEYIRLGDLLLEDGVPYIRLTQPIKVDGETVKRVEIKNITVGDFIEMEVEPTALVNQGAPLPTLLKIAQKMIGCTDKEAGAMSAGDITRLWGLFMLFFLGR